MDTSNWVNIGILAVTALVGLLTWIGSRKSASEAKSSADKANSIQEEMLELEKQRDAETSRREDSALLVPSLHRRLHRNGKYNEYFLIIENRGNALARNIAISINDQPIDSREEFYDSERFSDATIGAGMALELRYGLSMDSAVTPPFDVSLEWDDDSGNRGKGGGTVS